MNNQGSDRNSIFNNIRVYGELIIGSITPTTTDQVDLGSPSKRFKNLYISDNIFYNSTDSFYETYTSSGNTWLLFTNPIVGEYTITRIGRTVTFSLVDDIYPTGNVATPAWTYNSVLIPAQFRPTTFENTTCTPGALSGASIICQTQITNTGFVRIFPIIGAWVSGDSNYVAIFSQTWNI